MTRVTITGWEEGLKKISLSKLLQSEANLTLAEAKRGVDAVLEGDRVTLTFGSAADAMRFTRAARALNAVCEITDGEDP